MVLMKFEKALHEFKERVKARHVMRDHEAPAIWDCYVKLLAAAQPVMLDGNGNPIDGSPFVVPDDKFVGFASPAASQLPGYLTPQAMVGAAGGFFLPYRVYYEADFSYFSGIGL